MNDEITLGRAWFRKADSDLATVRRNVAGEGPYDTACFHAQQAVEKYLKGFLALNRRAIPRTHDLEEVAELCAEIKPIAGLAGSDLADLTDFAVTTRYDLDFWPTQEEARQALTVAERVRSIILAHVPNEANPE